MPACAADPRPTVADILRDHAHLLRLGDHQRRVVRHIVDCRTPALGGHVGFCDNCGHPHFSYHSCRDRHCPQCGGLDQVLWAEAQADHLLPVQYFHVVFTVPECLRPLFAGRGRAAALDALFTTAAQTLLELGQTHFGVVLGVLAVLHTWTQRLDFHPHLHCLVPGGGLGPHGWVHRRTFLFHVKQMSALFKPKLVAQLEALNDSGVFGDHRVLVRHALEQAVRRGWVVYAKRPIAGPEQVIAYFARYVRRIAISNSRIVDYDGSSVTFLWRDRRDKNKVKPRTIPADVFARKFVNHILPPRFVRIRRYGILSNRVRNPALTRSRELITGAAPEAAPPRTPETRVAACIRIFGKDPSRCPACNVGRIVRYAALRPHPVSAAVRHAAARNRAP